MEAVQTSLQMWATFGLIAGAIVFYASERLQLEQISIGLIIALLLLFHFAPVTRPHGVPFDARHILAGFADPALFSVLALLVIGQGLVRTGALDDPLHRLTASKDIGGLPLFWLALLIGAVLSAFVNNTPVVVVFIPVMAALSQRLKTSSSQLMMPLSFASILGGMTTLIGSSTNLLVAGTLIGMGLPAMGLFDFVVPGTVLAAIGMVYCLLVLPRLLPQRALVTGELGDQGKQFIAQITVQRGGSLVGQTSMAGMFPRLKNMTVRLVQRDGLDILPPFEDLTLMPGDVLSVAATRSALLQALKSVPDLTEQDDSGPTIDPVLAEVMVAPASRVIGRNMRQVGFFFHTGCVVLGVQRRSRMLRTALNDIRLEAGDVLLVLGSRTDVENLRQSRELLLIEQSAHDVPTRDRAWHARVIFAGVVVAASTGLVPIVIAALAGALAMVATGCLNIHQASRAVDRRVIVLVGAALAMGSAMQATGGAGYLVHVLMDNLSAFGPTVILSVLFLLVALTTNVLSNNATAVLFTPIAIGTATALNSDPVAFVHAVIFAANCSFATPIGYQTNLLVMGPGHYRFRDFLLGGTPLVLLIWACFSVLAPMYYEL